MKISEAIRLGALLTKPLEGSYAAYDETGKPVAACALGAAAHAVGALRRNLNWTFHLLNAAFPGAFVPTHLITCSCGCQSSNLASFIVHLNDNHEYSRDEIADHIAAYERERERVEVDRNEGILQQDRHGSAPSGPQQPVEETRAATVV
jgi:hypothetical protein